MSLIPFPNVPQVPGVPAIPRSINFPAAAKIALGAVQSALWSVLQVRTQWGVVDSSGKHLADPSIFTAPVTTAIGSLGIGPVLSTNSVDYSKETRVSDFPIEGGKFASYNKVELAATPTVTLCLGGTESDRTAFLTAIDSACKSTDLYSVVTPEVTYADYSLERYNYQRRSDRGATLLLVEISLKEVRQVSAQYVKTEKPKDPAATSIIDVGKVQAKIPGQSTLKAAYNKIQGLVR